ncbi:bifunctional 2-polyprenyl-6-hydroxyphenol methylase/3-demethylubiquinol 3-O-methyltransferase UbiG [Flavobacterium sp. K5-23]|uniref:class I SAM-dependent methyltransferase n=1 Tax=Flavobacterium sp. K5-23 TaxID=2746225 RepID=UPI00200E4855|nr:class I SAM-dependent methyltransferase [Flavobacterium sp. K5-23]UQD56145.1 class I SAM-dependent methyltransferase [Flavobacterium sp. K5-23]
MKNLEFTGERMTTGLGSVHGVIEHLHRYAIAQKITNNKVVLDIASGEGYGSFLLSKSATKVFGVDIDEESINHAKVKYASSKNIEFSVGSTDAIPLEDRSVDVVISFETIEHHDKHDLMMKEISRVLKKNGVLLISSPEKSIYSSRDPNNPYHIKELTLDDFSDLLKRNFKNVNLFNQRFVIGSLIHLIDQDCESKFNLFDGDYLQIKNKLDEDDFYNKSYFNLAICSNANNNDYLEVGSSIFNGVRVVKEEINVLKESYEKQYNNILSTESFKLGNSIIKKINSVRKLLKR